MELRHLRYFVTVAEELHFGRAAVRLFISQPPLSQQIQQLEREIGVPLLFRTSRRVQLTPAGEIFLRDSRRLLADAAQAVQSARRAARGETGWLGIGFAASATYNLLPAVLHDFRASFPSIELSLVELNAAEQAAALHDRSIHVGFARPPVLDPAFFVDSVLREPYVAALPQAHSLAAKSKVSLPELAPEPFISFPELPSPSYAGAVREACESAGFTPLVVQEVREMQTAISLVVAGLGIALLPASAANLHRAGLVLLPLEEPAPQTELAVLVRRNDPSPVLENFLAIVREQIGRRERG